MVTGDDKRDDKRDEEKRAGWIVLAIAATLLLVPVALHVPVLLRYRRERAAARHVKALGGSCRWWPGSPPWPFSRLAPLLGKRYAKLFERMDLIGLGDTKVADADLALLDGLAGLRVLNLSNTQVTDAGVAHLKGLAGLEYLILADTKVTDAGLAHLRGLTGLAFLNLSDTQVTDAGIAHLKGLTGLVGQLWLRNTRVTGAGVAELKAALPYVEIER